MHAYVGPTLAIATIVVIHVPFVTQMWGKMHVHVR